MSLKARIQRMKTCEYWTIAYRKQNPDNALYHGKVVEGFQPLKQKKYITQADPFLYCHQGQNYLFYEKQDLTDMKGSIWCVNLDDRLAKPVPALEEAFHLSYPQVFRYGKYTYMVPETRNAGEIRLYKCEQFPGKWSDVKALWEIPAVDTTFLLPERAEELKETDNPDVYAFMYTEGRLEIYLCRPLNGRFLWDKAEKIYESLPLKSVRPGGGIVREGERLFRPAQECGKYYGEELIFYEITQIGEDSYEEKEYNRLTPKNITVPDINPVGIHTYNQNGNYEVIDILHRQIGWGVVLRKIKWRLWSRIKG